MEASSVTCFTHYRWGIWIWLRLFCFNPCDKLMFCLILLSISCIHSQPAMCLVNYSSTCIFFSSFLSPAVAQPFACICVKTRWAFCLLLWNGKNVPLQGQADSLSICFTVIYSVDSQNSLTGRVCICVHVYVFILCVAAAQHCQTGNVFLGVWAREIYKKKVMKLLLLLLSDCVDTEYKVTFNVNFSYHKFSNRGYLLLFNG